MILQSTGNKVLAAVLFTAGLLFSAAGTAQAQVVTHTTLRVSPREDNASGTFSEASPGAVLTAHVSDVAGTPATGVVSFLSQGKGLGSAVLDEHGDATLSLDPTNQLRQVTAVYQGTGQDIDGSSGTRGFGASASSQLTLPGSSATVPGFQLASTPATNTVTAGQYGTYVISVTPQGGFAEAITLSCSNVPITVTCKFTPPIMTALQGSYNAATLQIQTQSPSGRSIIGQLLPASGTSLALAMLLLPGALLVAGRRRRGTQMAASRILCLFVCLVAIAGIGGCNERYSYKRHPPAGNPGTTPGTYTITLNGYGNSGTSVTSQSIPLTLTVK